MPTILHGKKLTPKEHRQWRHVNRTAGPRAATAAVKKSRAKRKK